MAPCFSSRNSAALSLPLRLVDVLHGLLSLSQAGDSTAEAALMHMVRSFPVVVIEAGCRQQLHADATATPTAPAGSPGNCEVLKAVFKSNISPGPVALYHVLEEFMLTDSDSAAAVRAAS